MEGFLMPNPAAWFVISALLTLPAFAQQTYRCVSPNGAVSFQDKPCPQGAKQSGVAKPAPQTPSSPRIRPIDSMSMSSEQTQAWFALQVGYGEVFVVLGRARACKQNMQDKQRELTAEIRRRHAQDADKILEGLRSSLAMGAAQTEPALACDSIKPRLQALRLPAIPDSLAISDDKPHDTIVDSGYVGRRSYQVMKRAHPGGREEYLLMQDGKVFYQSPEVMRAWRPMDGPVPALLLSLIDKTRDCPSQLGDKGIRWLVIGLPQNGAPVVSPLNLDCTIVYPYGDKSLCAWAIDKKRPSILYRVDASGVPVRNGEYKAGDCPSQ
jgi:hypothetical protein